MSFIENRINRFAIYGVLLYFTALLSACTRNGTYATLDFHDAQYIVSLSKTYENKSLLIVVGKGGTVNQTVCYEGQGINSITFRENDLYLHSSRENRHFILNGQGEWQSFSLAKNDVEGSENAPSWFAANGEHSLIETMNIGFVDNHYESAVLYTENGQKKNVIIEDLCLENAVEHDGEIYVNSSDYAGEKGNVICVIDKQTGIYNMVRFPHGNTPASGRLVLANDKIITYGSNAAYLIASGDDKFCCTLGMLDTKTHETKEIDYSDDAIILLYTFHNQIFVVTEKGNLHIYTDELSLTDTRNLNHTELLEAYSSSELIPHLKIIETDDILSMLFIRSELDPHNIGFIQEYRKTDLQPVRKIDLFLSGTDEWIGENIDFVLLP